MNNQRWSRVNSFLALLCVGVAFATADLHASEKQKVIAASELNTDTLVDALDIGDSAAAKDEKLTRGMQPVRPSSLQGKQENAGGGASTGKAPLLVTFKTGSSELTADGMTMLSKVAQALQSERLAGFSFVVEGHADPRGTERQNLKLSQSRADSVARHLASQHGVVAARLKPVGRGSAELYDAVRTDAPENRRVTLVTLRP